MPDTGDQRIYFVILFVITLQDSNFLPLPRYILLKKKKVSSQACSNLPQSPGKGVGAQTVGLEVQHHGWLNSELQ